MASAAEAVAVFAVLFVAPLLVSASLVPLVCLPQSALWPCGRTLRDLLEEGSSNNYCSRSSRKRAAAEQCLESAARIYCLGGDSNSSSVENVSDSSSTSSSDLLTGADAPMLGRQGEGKTQRDLLQYACSLILQASSGSISARSRNSSNSCSIDNGGNGFGLCGSQYNISLEEAGVYGYISGDLSALFALAETWGDAAFAVCHSLHVSRSSRSLLFRFMLRQLLTYRLL